MSGSARADGLSLPYAPQAPGGQDSIETAEGTRCRSSINNGGPTLDIGVGHIRDEKSYAGASDETSTIGYARIVVPLGPKPERLNCKRLYDLEIARLKMELELMKMGLE